MLNVHELIKTDADVRERLQPVLLGGDILTYSCVRGFWEAYGIKSIVLAGFDPKVISTSRFAELRIVPDVDKADVCVSALRQVGAELVAKGKVPLVLGTGDWYARALSEHKEELSEWFVVPYIDFSLLNEITQKERFYQICEELDIPYPKTRTHPRASPRTTSPTRSSRSPRTRRATTTPTSRTRRRSTPSRRPGSCASSSPTCRRRAMTASSSCRT